jgi:hypothetical protein
VPFVIQDYPLTLSVVMTPGVIRRIVADNAKDGGGAIITPAAPASITARVSEPMAAKPGAETPTCRS